MCVAGATHDPSGRGNLFALVSEHIFASLVLLFSYGDMPWRPQVQDVIAKSIQVIKGAQKNRSSIQ